jgi:hypothetical protein
MIGKKKRDHLEMTILMHEGIIQDLSDGGFQISAINVYI